ncbi:MAG: hypothetical protein WCI72_02890 [archaeon]
MATNENYENGAMNLIGRIQATQMPREKERLMNGMGNLRFAQYRTTGDTRARRLAANCYLAARNFRYTAMQAQV